jgi:hypothetical protein
MAFALPGAASNVGMTATGAEDIGGWNASNSASLSIMSQLDSFVFSPAG